MALISCHECGKQVSTEAASCPGCGAPPKAPGAVAGLRMPPMPPEKEASTGLKVLKWGGGLVLGFFALVLVLGTKPQDPAAAARRKAECESAIKSGIGHSTRNYGDKLAYEKTVEDACGGADLPYLREARSPGQKEGCPAEVPNCSWGR